jgi:hypothetical protein
VTGDSGAALSLIRKTIASAALSCAAVLGFLLSTIGLYDVVFYDASRRTQHAESRASLRRFAVT